MRHKIADVVTGVAAAIVVFAAVPTVLVLLVGLPLPHHWDRADVLSSRGLFDLLAVMAWVAWAACCWPLARSVAERVRRRDAAIGTDARFTEWLATRIALAVLTIAPMGLGLGAAAGASGHRPPPAVHAPHGHSAPARTGAAERAVTPVTDGPVVPVPARAASSGQPTSIHDAAPTPAPTPVSTAYTVQPGDSLWSIATHFYGDGAEWPAIASVNLGQVMDDGTRFVDPSLILPGWVLTIPPTAPGVPPDAAPPAPTAAGPTTPATTIAATTTAAAVPAPQPAGAGVHAAHPRTDPRLAGTLGARPAGPAGTATRGRAVPRHPRRARRAANPDGHAPTRPPAPVPLPELAALGVGVLLAAAFARRARRARHAASLGREVGQRAPTLSDEAADVATLLSPFDHAPNLEWLEVANRHLAAALTLDGRVEDTPGVRLVRVGPDGVEVRLDTSVLWEPRRWRRRGERTWLLPATSDLSVLREEAQTHDPWLPVLAPVGDDDEGTWLVPLGPGQCLPVLGSCADGLVRALRHAQCSWGWAEGVVVTDDPEEARRTAASVAAAHGLLAPAIVYLGDQRALDRPTRARCRVITTQAVAASDLTILVDAHAVTVHPLGLTLRPHLLTGWQADALDELTSPTAPTPALPGGGAPSEEHDRDRTAAHHHIGPVHPRATVRASVGRHPAAVSMVVAGGGASERSELLPGPVEVRLLTAVPRIDGLADDLAPKRARRAIELVAYLALHHPDPVTSDRLRTRVLGSADADAAAKTLFNTAGAARRAMGRAPDGEAYLPLATKSGHYRVSELVTVDAARAVALVAAAEAAEDPDEAMALQREALGLVESEPLAGVLTGYTWWTGEGHERRAAAAIVDGACRLARRATAAGHVELARWALGRARLVEPYSEALSRVAMEVAALAGDTDELRREWADCQRRVDELDPGALPDEATERLYADLRRSLAAT